MAVTPAELASIPLFASLSEAEREQVAGWFEPRTAPEGCTLAGEGATGYCFFVLAEGHAAVSSNGAQLTTLGPGDFFGEIAILGDGRRSATVTTTTPVRLLVMSEASSGSCSRTIRRSGGGSKRRWPRVERANARASQA
jgi:CRP-like cAMP-binding protein